MIWDEKNFTQKVQEVIPPGKSILRLSPPYNDMALIPGNQTANPGMT